MKQRNIDIREYAKKKGVKLWEVAEVLGINDSVFSKKMRHELLDNEKTKIIEAIDSIYNSEAC